MSDLSNKSAEKQQAITAAAELKKFIVPETSANKTGELPFESNAREQIETRRSLVDALHGLRNEQVGSPSKGVINNTIRGMARTGEDIGGWYLGSNSARRMTSNIQDLSDEDRELLSVPEHLRTPEQNQYLNTKPEPAYEDGPRNFPVQETRSPNEIYKDFYKANFDNENWASATEAARNKIDFDTARRDKLTLDNTPLNEELEASVIEGAKTRDAALEAENVYDRTLGALEGTGEQALAWAKYGKGLTGNAFDNPGAVIEYIGEASVHAAASGISLFTSNAAYSTDLMAQGLRAFIKEEGRLPSRSEVNEMIAYNAVAGAADAIGDKVIGRAAGKLFKPKTNNTQKAWKESLEEATDESDALEIFTQKLTNEATTLANRSVVKKTADAAKVVASKTGKVAGTALIEGGTEGVQGIIEGSDTSLGLGQGGKFKDIDVQNALENVAAGFQTGGGLSAFSETAAPVTRAAFKTTATVLDAATSTVGIAANILGKTVVKPIADAVVNKQRKKTGNAGDPIKQAEYVATQAAKKNPSFSNLHSDPESELYNPALAVAEYNKVARNEELPDEIRKEALEKRNEVISDLENQISGNNDSVTNNQAKMAENRERFEEVQNQNFEFDAKKDLTPKEQKAIENFQEEKAKFQKELETTDKSDEFKEQLAVWISEIDGDIQRVIQDSEKIQRDKFERNKDSYSEADLAFDNDALERKINKKTSRNSNIQRELDRALRTSTSFTEAESKQFIADQAEVEANVSKATQGDAQAVQDIVASIKRDGTSISPEQANEILASTKDLDTDTKEFLTTYKEAYAANNKLKEMEGIKQNLATGERGFQGLDKYVKLVKEGIKSGNKKFVKAQISNIKKFADSQKKKEIALKSAMELSNKSAQEQKDKREAGNKNALETGKDVNIWLDSEGNYQIKIGSAQAPWSATNQPKLSRDQRDTLRSQMGGFTIRGQKEPNSKNTPAEQLLEVLKEETALIENTQALLENLEKGKKIPPKKAPTPVKTKEEKEGKPALTNTGEGLGSIIKGKVFKAVKDGLPIQGVLDFISKEFDGSSNLPSIIERTQTFYDAVVEQQTGKKSKAKPKKKKQAYAEKVLAKYKAIIDDPDSSTFEKINAAVSLLKNAKAAGNTNQAAEAQAVLAEFKEQGYETTLAVGDNYVDGMRVDADFVQDDSLYEDEQIIQRIVKPQINKDGKMVQAGSIVVSQGTKVREQPTTTADKTIDLETPKKYNLSKADPATAAPEISLNNIDLEASGLEDADFPAGTKVRLLETRGRNNNGVLVGTVQITAGNSVKKYEVFFKDPKPTTTTPEFDKLPEHQEGQKTFTYAGIGARNTPKLVLAKMAEIAKKLEELGYTLQSGGAKGADSAFESGTDTKQIFTTKDATDTTRKIAAETHPNLEALRNGTYNKHIKLGKSKEEAQRIAQYAVDLQARNTNQVFGEDLDTPVDFVLYWAEPSNNPDRPKGGTGQAVEMANRKGIPTINMMDDNWLEQLEAITTL